MRGSVAFAGAATGFIQGARGYSALEMMALVARQAAADAGLSLRQVDGLFVGMQQEFLSTLAFAEYLGIQPRFSENTRVGGSSFLCHTQQAALALNAGLCDVALICYASNQRSALGRLQTSVAGNWSDLEAPYAARFPVSSYALAAARHMHEFGTTREQLAAVAVAARDWARLNPEAFARNPLSRDAVLAAPLVSDPLGKLDCCLVTDGAAAVIMTRADLARDTAKPPVYLLGAAAEIGHKAISAMPDLCHTAALASGRRAHAEAGTSAADIDVVQLYDAFTINTVMLLEDLGFCPKGEGGRFVADGHIGPGGDLPVNTNGGGLSCCHPGMYGLFTLVEAIRQLRGEAGDRQVQGAELALCQGSGGVFSSQVTNILGSKATL
ncbi:acetyl-CoA acetyltransferase [Ferrovibrio sp.]|uniref:acetyl-CoA acetyltransferase n=1 Tax=Ferrovibrio sp. TaxID=1917215 RepID=UPI001B42A5D1|nr:acetyl-CoA acetyltransferase [Ferrovibrio sp.]MBP7063242.1 thiolase [Ferrovibrio sp.]